MDKNFLKYLSTAPVLCTVWLSFTAGFIIEITNIFRSYGMELAKMEIKRYLLESKENNPWEYAKYRCRTISNVYADIQWAYCEGEKSND